MFEEVSVLGCNRTQPITQSKGLGRCVSDANSLQDQICEAHQIATHILSELVGTQPDKGCNVPEHAGDVGGRVGDLCCICQRSSDRASELLTTLRQIANHV